MSESRPSFRRSFGGLVGAMLVVLGAIAAVWLLSRFQSRPPTDPAQPVNYLQPLAQARRSAPFPVAGPTEVPVDWTATSAQLTREGPLVTWQVGFLTAAGDFVGLYQSNEAAHDFLIEHTTASRPCRPLPIDGARWRCLSGSDGETALTRTTRGVTTLVTGTASISDLSRFTQSLRYASAAR